MAWGWVRAGAVVCTTGAVRRQAESPALVHRADQLWQQKLLEKGVLLGLCIASRSWQRGGVHIIYKCIIWVSARAFGRPGDAEKERVHVFIGMRVLVERIWHQKLGCLLQNALFDQT